MPVADVTIYTEDNPGKISGDLLLKDFILHLADNALILAQRNSAWCGHGPVLEQDIALTNISLDLLGQAQYFYELAALLINKQTDKLQSAISPGLKNNAAIITADTLAYLRNEREFKNCLLVEQPIGDWGQTILRQFLFSTYQLLLYEQLKNSKVEGIAAIAAKALKEITYHVRWSSEWVIRLGDGSTVSHQRMLAAIAELWPFTGELFIPADFENENITGINLSSLQQLWFQKISAVLKEATLLSAVIDEGIERKIFMQKGGKQGTHSEHMGFILAELQYLQRAYPNSEW